VDSVWPSYGPVNGGTRVTITGQFLSTASVTAVHLGRHTLLPNANGLQLSFIFAVLQFYHATPCLRGICCGSVSVRLSVRYKSVLYQNS